MKRVTVSTNENAKNKRIQFCSNNICQMGSSMKIKIYSTLKTEFLQLVKMVTTLGTKIKFLYDSICLMFETLWRVLREKWKTGAEFPSR